MLGDRHGVQVPAIRLTSWPLRTSEVIPLKELYLLYTILILIAVSLNPVLLRAQTPVNSPLKTFETEIQDFQQQIGVWERQEHIQIALVVAVVVFGALISAFQGSVKKWGKVATLA